MEGVDKCLSTGCSIADGGRQAKLANSVEAPLCTDSLNGVIGERLRGSAANIGVPEQCRDRHAEVLPLQIEQSRFDRGHSVDRGTQVESLIAATT